MGNDQTPTHAESVQDRTGRDPEHDPSVRHARGGRQPHENSVDTERTADPAQGSRSDSIRAARPDLVQVVQAALRNVAEQAAGPERPGISDRQQVGASGRHRDPELVTDPSVWQPRGGRQPHENSVDTERSGDRALGSRSDSIRAARPDLVQVVQAALRNVAEQAAESERPGIRDRQQVGATDRPVSQQRAQAEADRPYRLMTQQEVAQARARGEEIVDLTRNLPPDEVQQQRQREADSGLTAATAEAQRRLDAASSHDLREPEVVVVDTNRQQAVAWLLQQPENGPAAARAGASSVENSITPDEQGGTAEPPRAGDTSGRAREGLGVRWDPESRQLEVHGLTEQDARAILGAGSLHAYLEDLAGRQAREFDRSQMNQLTDFYRNDVGGVHGHFLAGVLAILLSPVAVGTDAVRIAYRAAADGDVLTPDNFQPASDLVREMLNADRNVGSDEAVAVGLVHAGQSTAGVVTGILDVPYRLVRFAVEQDQQSANQLAEALGGLAGGALLHRTTAAMRETPGTQGAGSGTGRGEGPRTEAGSAGRSHGRAQSGEAWIEARRIELRERAGIGPDGDRNAALAREQARPLIGEIAGSDRELARRVDNVLDAQARQPLQGGEPLSVDRALVEAVATTVRSAGDVARTYSADIARLIEPENLYTLRERNVIPTNANNLYRHSSPAEHNLAWAERGGSGPAPPAFVDTHGQIHVNRTPATVAVGRGVRLETPPNTWAPPNARVSGAPRSVGHAELPPPPSQGRPPGPPPGPRPDIGSTVTLPGGIGRDTVPDRPPTVPDGIASNHPSPSGPSGSDLPHDSGHGPPPQRPRRGSDSVPPAARPLPLSADAADALLGEYLNGEPFPGALYADITEYQARWRAEGGQGPAPSFGFEDRNGGAILLDTGVERAGAAHPSGRLPFDVPGRPQGPSQGGGAANHGAGQASDIGRAPTQVQQGERHRRGGSRQPVAGGRSGTTDSAAESSPHRRPAEDAPPVAGAAAEGLREPGDTRRYQSSPEEQLTDATAANRAALAREQARPYIDQLHLADPELARRVENLIDIEARMPGQGGYLAADADYVPAAWRQQDVESARQQILGTAPLEQTYDAGVAAELLRTGQGVKKRVPWGHNSAWAAAGGSGTAPSAFRTADGVIHVMVPRVFEGRPAATRWRTPREAPPGGGVRPPELRNTAVETLAPRLPEEPQ